MKADFFPIILGSDENAYGTARLFHEAYGVKALLLCRYQLPATADSRILRLEIIPDLQQPDVFVRSLREVLLREGRVAEKLLVVPCADYYTRLLSENAELFEGRIANPVVPKMLLDRLDAKPAFYELCKKYGLPCPQTLVIPEDKRIEAEGLLPDRFPVVLKPENSNASEYLACSFPGKKKVYYIRSREEYRELTRAMTEAGYHGTLVAQEYIPGGEDALRMLNTYSDADGTVRAMGLGQVLLTDHHPLMRGNSVAMISRYDRALAEQIRSFLEDIHYTGFANFDLKTDPETGRTILFECNPRLGRSSFFLRAAGLNIMKVMTEDAVYGRREDCVFVKDRALWRNVPMGVLKKHMKNRELYREATELSAAGMGLDTRSYSADRSLKRNLKMLRYDLSLMRCFGRYPADED